MINFPKFYTKLASSNAVDDEQPNQRQYYSGSDDHSNSSGEAPIRTVYIRNCVIEPQSIDDINNHFGQFGEIESVSMQSEDKQTQWCLVRFKRQEDAEEAHLRTGNKWMGFDVKAAHPWHQPEHPLQVAPEQDSYSNISVALNDDCLQEIFKLLKLSCLTNVAGVCKRFNQQAKITFALKHKHLDLNKQFHQHRDLIASAMEHFGKGIQSLIIHALLFSKEPDAIRVIRLYCGPKLKHLELQYFEFCSDLNVLRPIFAQIEQLKLDQCSGHIWSQIFPKLQNFSIAWNNFSDDTFKSFITRHPTLIKLSIENALFSPRLLSTIGQHAKQLQELKLFRVHKVHKDSQFQNAAAYIGQMSALKKMQIYFENGSIVPLLNTLIAGEAPIESMEIQFNRQPNVDQTIKCISQFKRIKILQLTTNLWTRRVTDEHVVELAEGLPELEALHLTEIHWRSDSTDYKSKSQLSTIGLRKMLMHANKLKLLELLWIESIKIDVDDYEAMLSMVQKRKEKWPLLIEIYGKGDQVDVPAPVLAKTRSTISIKEIR